MEASTDKCFDFTQASPGPLALYGGTFDPVHRGHIYVARQVMAALGLDKVVFLPSGQPPHKVGHVRATAAHRWRMLELALEGEEGLYLSDYEINRRTRCFTADTLTALDRLCPAGTQLVFIVGADSLMELEGWYRPGVILEHARLAAVVRPGIREEALRRECQRLREVYGARIDLVFCGGQDISSTRVREAAQKGCALESWVPERASKYIRDEHIYQEARS